MKEPRDPLIYAIKPYVNTLNVYIKLMTTFTVYIKLVFEPVAGWDSGALK